jgi:hypothetical protein
LIDLHNNIPGSKLIKDIDRVFLETDNLGFVGISCGDGSKIRGMRNSTVLYLDPYSIPREVLENIPAGFAVTDKRELE